MDKPDGMSNYKRPFSEYRTYMCTQGEDCPNKDTCFLAHSEEEFRQKEDWMDDNVKQMAYYS